jgi:hypothetical protein
VSLFRRHVLERLSAPEQLDQLMQITTPKNWIAIIGLCLVVAAVVVWGFFWTSPTTLAAQGMLVPEGGIQRVAAPQAGQVSQVAVKPGDRVNPGDTVATLAPSGGAAPVNVTAPSPGTILAVSASPNQAVDSGAELLLLIPFGKPLQVAAFVPVSQLGGARPGMSVHVAPASVDPTRFGFVKGTIASVGAFPATAQELRQALGTDELVRSFTAPGPVVTVVITPTADANTPSGFAWSSPKGPPYPLTGGTFAKATIVLNSSHPFRLKF